MAYTFAQIQTEVRANVNDAAASVTTIIDQAINLLSNYFHLKKTATGNTVAGTAYITKPANCLKIERLTIGTTEFQETEAKKLQEVEDFELNKFYDTDEKIYLTPTPSAVEAYKIWYKSGFTALNGAGSTDAPDRIVPLLIVLATWLYWAQIATKTATQRELFPDMTPEEAKKTANTWKQQFDQMLRMVHRLK